METDCEPSFEGTERAETLASMLLKAPGLCSVPFQILVRGGAYFFRRARRIKSAPDSKATAVPADPRSISGATVGAKARPDIATNNNDIPASFMFVTFPRSYNLSSYGVRESQGERLTAMQEHSRPTLDQSRARLLLPKQYPKPLRTAMPFLIPSSMLPPS